VSDIINRPTVADHVGTVAAFLRWAHGRAIDARLPGRVVISQKNPPGSQCRYTSKAFKLDELEQAAAGAVRISASALNAYVRVHLVDRHIAKTERGKSEDTSIVTHYAADVDIAGPGHAPRTDGTLHPPDLATAVELIDATLAPSAIISSGGGLYPTWRLSEPFVITDEDDRQRVSGVGKRLDTALAGHGWHVDPTCCDLARIIRPPGVTNHKPGRDPRPVIVYRGWVDGAGDYTLDQLERLLPQTERQTHKRARPLTTTASSGVAAWDLFKARYTLDEILADDDRHTWHRVNDVNGWLAWRRDGSDSDYSIKQNPDTGVIIVWSSVIAAELDIDPGDGLDLWGFACRLAGRDPAEAARAVKR
jgi:hypothetical protein